jgi:hypothetical protein
VLLAFVASSTLVGLGCGVVNPGILGAVGSNTGGTVSDPSTTSGNVVIMLMNQTNATAQANVRVTKVNGGTLDLNMAAAANDFAAVTQSCEVQTIQVVQASFAGPTGAVNVPAAVSPFTMGTTMQCGSVIAITLTGTPPSILIGVQGF